jgi:hypothetical protein
MADNLGPMAWLFLQENVQVQYLQKIALRAENKPGPRMGITSTNNIFCVSNFLLPLGQHIFRPRRLMLCSNQGKGPHSWGRP